MLGDYLCLNLKNCKARHRNSLTAMSTTPQVNPLRVHKHIKHDSSQTVLIQHYPQVIIASIEGFCCARCGTDVVMKWSGEP